MANFKKQRIVGDGVSGADMLSHISSGNPHSQYALASDIATKTELLEHNIASDAHNEILIPKTDIVTDYIDSENANKVVAASAINAIGTRVTDIENGLVLAPSGYSAYLVSGLNTMLLGTSAYLESTKAAPLGFFNNSVTASSIGTYFPSKMYILNNELFDTTGKKYTLSHLSMSTGTWSEIQLDAGELAVWLLVNDGTLFFKANRQLKFDIASGWIKNEVAKINFSTSQYNTGWHTTSIELYKLNVNSMFCIIQGIREGFAYIASFQYEGRDNFSDTTQILTLQDELNTTNTITIPNPKPIYRINGGATTAIGNCKQIVGGSIGGYGAYVLTTDNVLYLLPASEYFATYPTAVLVSPNISKIFRSRSRYLYAITVDGKLLRISSSTAGASSLYEIDSTKGPYTDFAISAYSNIYNYYCIGNNNLYKLGGIDDILTPVIGENFSSKWTSVVCGQAVDDVDDTEHLVGIGIHNGDLCYLDDVSITQLTTSKDWVSLKGGANLALAFKKNAGTVVLPEGTLTTADISNSFVLDATKILNAEIVTQFREAYLVHDHNAVYDDRYLFKTHTDLGVNPNPHPQYVLISNLENSGVFVQNPLEDSVPVYRRSDTISNQTTLFIYIDTQTYSVKLENTNATGTSRVWSGISEYDNTFIDRLISVDDDNTIQYSNLYEVPQDSSKVIGTLDKINPCCFYIDDGNLKSNSITLDASVNEGGKGGGWSMVTGYVLTQGNYRGYGVGVCNDELYLLNLNGTVTLITDSIGNWTYLVGSIISNTTINIHIGAAWAIKDNNTLCAIVLNKAGDNPIILETTANEFGTITMCSTDAYTFTSSNYKGKICDFIANGNIYRATYDETTGTIVVIILNNTYSDWEQVQTKKDSPKAIRAGELYAGTNLDYLIRNPDNMIAIQGGWTDISSNYGIFDNMLYHFNGSSVSYPITINNTIVRRWTKISGNGSGSPSDLTLGFSGLSINYGYLYPLGICDNKAYLIDRGAAIELSDTYGGIVTNVYGMAYRPKLGDPYTALTLYMSGIYTKESQSQIEVSAKDTSNPFKWVIRKIKSTGATTIAASNERATATEPWDATWTLANTSVVLDMTDNGFWASVEIASLVQEATDAIKGISKPAENGGIEIHNGNLLVAPEIAKLHQLKNNTIPIYGYDFQNEDIIISAGVTNIPYLTKEVPSATDTDRVWVNFDEYGANKLGIISNTTLNIIPLSESLSSLEESDNSSTACNYTIINGKAYYISDATTIEQVGSDATWTKVSGFYSDLGSGEFTYAYGINDGKLYKLAGTVVTSLNSATTGWTDICGYSSNLTPNFYAYGIRNSLVYYISNETVSAVTGKTGIWSKISGIGGTYAGQTCTAYGLVFNLATGTELCKLGTTAVVVPGSGKNWEDLTGYTYLDSIAYGIKDTYLFKLTPDGVIGIDSIPGWSKISGLGYANSGCCYGILNGSLYAIKDTVLVQFSLSTGWSDICGDYSGAFKRYGYGINNGHIYRLYDTTATKLTQDGGWTKIFGRCDVVDFVVCAKLDEHSYKLSADEVSGKWLLQEYVEAEYVDIAESYEPASGTNPWDCTWVNSVIVLDVISHSGWTGIPITEFITIGVLNDRLDAFESAMLEELEAYVSPTGNYVTTTTLSGYTNTTNMNTAINTAVTAPLTIVPTATTTCTLTPGKLYTWSLSGVTGTLTSSGFSVTGFEYGYLEVTLANAAAITVNPAITQTNAFVDDSVNFCVIRNVAGVLRLTVVDTY